MPHTILCVCSTTVLLLLLLLVAVVVACSLLCLRKALAAASAVGGALVARAVRVARHLLLSSGACGGWRESGTCAVITGQRRGGTHPQLHQ